MKEDKSKNIIIGVLVVMVIILSGVIIYMYMTKDDVIINLNDNEEQVDNDNGSEVKKLTEDEAIVIGKELYDKATKIYETWVVLPYCGYDLQDINSQSVKSELLGNYGMGNGYYYKSNFSSYDDLVTYLGNWLSEDIINEKVVKSYEWNNETYYKYVEDLSLIFGTDSHYSYVDYVLKDGALYCRLDTGKGWVPLYLGIYDITVDGIEENKIIYNIKSTYITQESFSSGSSNCTSGNVNNCTSDQLEYEDTKFIIEKNDSGNWIVTDYTLHG